MASPGLRLKMALPMVRQRPASKKKTAEALRQVADGRHPFHVAPLDGLEGDGHGDEGGEAAGLALAREGDFILPLAVLPAQAARLAAGGGRGEEGRLQVLALLEEAPLQIPDRQARNTAPAEQEGADEEGQRQQNPEPCHETPPRDGSRALSLLYRPAPAFAIIQRAGRVVETNEKTKAEEGER